MEAVNIRILVYHFEVHAVQKRHLGAPAAAASGLKGEHYDWCVSSCPRHTRRVLLIVNSSTAPEQYAAGLSPLSSGTGLVVAGITIHADKGQQHEKVYRLASLSMAYGTPKNV
jgi:hypothetical protein